MRTTELLSKTPFSFHKEWNELHIFLKKNEVIKFYVNNRIFDHSIDLKEYLITYADSLKINVKNILSATLYLCNEEGQNKSVKRYTFP